MGPLNKGDVRLSEADVGCGNTGEVTVLRLLPAANQARGALNVTAAKKPPSLSRPIDVSAAILVDHPLATSIPAY